MFNSLANLSSYLESLSECPPQNAHHWMPTTGCPPLDAHYRMSRTGCPLQDAHRRMPSTGCPAQDAQHRMPSTGCPAQDVQQGFREDSPILLSIYYNPRMIHMAYHTHTIITFVLLMDNHLYKRTRPTDSAKLPQKIYKKKQLRPLHLCSLEDTARIDAAERIAGNVQSIKQ